MEPESSLPWLQKPALYCLWSIVKDAYRWLQKKHVKTHHRRAKWETSNLIISLFYKNSGQDRMYICVCGFALIKVPKFVMFRSM